VQLTPLATAPLSVHAKKEGGLDRGEHEEGCDYVGVPNLMEAAPVRNRETGWVSGLSWYVIVPSSDWTKYSQLSLW
jgi:hypothetical protein